MNVPRYAIVTGAASGIGRALALRLARDGWRLALVDLNATGAEETLQQVRAAGGDGQVEPLDVRDLDGWRALRARLEQQWPRLDLLVNNAGVCAGGEVGAFPVEDWRWVLDINLHGVFYGCDTMLDWLKQNAHGAQIMNIASIAAFLGAPAMASYNAAKAAVVALSETLHAELAPRGVAVSVVCPGFVPTPLLDQGRFPDPHILESARGYMQRAQLTPDDVAAAAVRALTTKQLYVVLGWRARLLWRFKRYFPRLFNHLIIAGYRRSLPNSR